MQALQHDIALERRLRVPVHRYPLWSSATGYYLSLVTYTCYLSLITILVGAVDIVSEAARSATPITHHFSLITILVGADAIVCAAAHRAPGYYLSLITFHLSLITILVGADDIVCEAACSTIFAQDARRLAVADAVGDHFGARLGFGFRV